MKNAAGLDQSFLDKQKSKLLQARQVILNSLNNAENKEDFQIHPDQVREDGDQAQALLNQQFSMSMHERNLQRVREIDGALEKIENGSYGICEESGEPIETKRLENHPWARLCLQQAELAEQNIYRFRAG